MDTTPGRPGGQRRPDSQAAGFDSGALAAVEATETFVAHRNLLFTVAYEMLGSAADAEDVMQETWLRWVKVDVAQVSEQRAYLVRITTRQSLNRLRSMKRRREEYVGSWLPAPLLTAPDVAADVELSESVSMALMLVLETLTPTERAVFVLREAFGIGYDEIAAAVDKTPAAVHQIAHRARRHVAARRPRRAVTARQTRAALEADVPLTVEPTVVNGSPALALHVDGELDGVIAMRVEDSRITGLYYVRNPQKLTHIDSETSLTLR
jgi:RNA polymerase sigma factor (sigma-70 family)